MAKNEVSKVFIFIALIGIIFIVGGNLFAVTAVNDVYWPIKANVKCEVRTTAPDSINLYLAPTEDVDYKCDAQNCYFTKIKKVNGPYADGLIGALVYTSAANSINIDSKTYHFDSEGYVDLYMHRDYGAILDIERPGSYWDWSGDQVYRLEMENTLANVVVTSDDRTYPDYSNIQDACDLGEIPDGDFGSYTMQDGESFDIDVGYGLEVSKLVFTNPEGEICYGGKIGYVYQDIDGYNTIQPSPNQREVTSCSPDYCYKQDLFMSDDFTCTDKQEDSLCFGDSTKCEDGEIIFYDCDAGKLVDVSSTGESCCSTNYDCGDDEFCSGGVCREEAPIHETCGEFQCCIGTEDGNYVESLNSIYTKGKACPTGMDCFMAEDNYVGTCSYDEKDEKDKEGTECNPAGVTQTCAKDGIPGVRTCTNDEEWGACDLIDDDGIPFTYLVIGGIGLLTLFLLFGDKKKTIRRRVR